ncbi:MAG: hypothetical protein ACRYGF_05985 [Janthinobacterium lividum]
MKQTARVPEQTHAKGRPLLWPYSLSSVSAVLGIIATMLYFTRVVRTGIANFKFDDALMFVRYADHVRSGYGLSWNPFGPHTFGLTSLAWFGVTLFASFLPGDPVAKLVSGSCLFGLAACLVLAYAPRAMQRDSVSPAVLFPMVALPLMLHADFAVSLTNGMETMLAFLLISVFVLAVQKALAAPRNTQALAVALLGWLVVLTRPEALLCVVAFPVCWWALVQRRQGTQGLVGMLAVLAGLLAATLLWARLYFGTALPLPMYAKWLRGYAGYRLYLNPLAYNLYFLNMAALPCLALACLVRRTHLRRILAFLLPLLLQCAYLFTVLQIMGWGGRYYVPYLPFLFVPALQVVAAKRPKWPVLTPRRLAALCVAGFTLNLQMSKPLAELMARRITRNRVVFSEPVFQTQATLPLPEVEWWLSCAAFARIASVLPPGTLVSSSEVGVLGAARPDIRILDTSGLNDPAIAQHGFSAKEVMEAQPEVIWMIHPDYTRDYGELSAEPSLLQQYTLYAHALNFGVAVRKDSPYRAQLTAALEREWRVAYPGFPMDPYVTEKVRWSPQPQVGSGRFLVTQP